MTKTALTLHFTELFLALLKGKINLADALHILSREGVEKPIRENAVSLLSTMKKGKGLSESLALMGKGKVVFEPLYLTLIGAAELTGNIEGVLERIVIDLRRKQRARDNVINILIYPVLVVFTALAGTALLIVKGMPLFISGGLVSGAAVSKAAAGIGGAGVVLALGGGALFAVYFRIFYRDSPGFRIFYLLDVLLRSNVPLPEALSQCIVSMARTKYGGALVRVKKNLVAGMALSEAFSKTKYFPPYVLGWLSVAVTHGNIREICGNIRDHYARKDDRLREAAARLIEPAVIALTGLYLLIIMMTVVLPILTRAGGAL